MRLLKNSTIKFISRKNCETELLTFYQVGTKFPKFDNNRTVMFGNEILISEGLIAFG